MTDYTELVKSLRVCGKSLEAAAFPEWDVCLYTQAADAIEELSKRIDRAVELYNRGVEKSAMWEALEGISPEPPKEETE